MVDISTMSQISNIYQKDQCCNLNVSDISNSSHNSDQDTNELLQLLDYKTTLMEDIPEQSNDSSMASQDEQILDLARALKTEICELLKDYANDILSKQFKSLNQKMVSDTNKIKQKLSDLQHKKDFELKQQTEVTDIIKMVADFLTKLEEIKQSLKFRLTQKISLISPDISTEMQLQKAYNDQTTDIQTKEDFKKLIESINLKITQLVELLTNQYSQIEKFKQIALSIASSNINTISKEFDDLRLFSKQLNQEEQQIAKKIVKICFIKCNKIQGIQSYDNNLASCIQEKNIDSITDQKRKFYEFILKIKYNLPKDHPAQKIMISQYYDIIENKQIPETEWNQFFQNQITLI